MRIGDYITVLRDGQITGHAMVKDIDTRWIVRSMIGSDAKDFAKSVDHRLGEEAFRAEEICLPRRTGGLASTMSRSRYVRARCWVSTG
ncbi:hypothetical protein F2981_27095 (plasmid) [Sinorhizobium meliloti]|nr:hypothetical protein [Sinorhizobium meliloti]